MHAAWLIARSVLIEAIRRKEIYVIVLASVLIIGAVMTIDFFSLEGITKFYREIALKVMSTATGITVIVLASRQLPREFENRTIYPLLAKPVTRVTFLTGKLLGVMLAAVFCFALFMAVYVGGALYLGSNVPVLIFVQYLYLQLLMMLVLATLSFLLSLVMNFDAAVTFGILLFLISPIVTNALSTPFLYEGFETGGRYMLLVLNYVIPQYTLFDLSEKTVHDWDPVGAWVIGAMTLYALAFAVPFYLLSLFVFGRRAL